MDGSDDDLKSTQLVSTGLARVFTHFADAPRTPGSLWAPSQRSSPGPPRDGRTVRVARENAAVPALTVRRLAVRQRLTRRL